MKWEPVAKMVPPVVLPVFPFKGSEWKEQCDTCRHGKRRGQSENKHSPGGAGYWCRLHKCHAIDARLGPCGVEARSHEAR